MIYNHLSVIGFNLSINRGEVGSFDLEGWDTADIRIGSVLSLTRIATTSSSSALEVAMVFGNQLTMALHGPRCQASQAPVCALPIFSRSRLLSRW